MAILAVSSIIPHLTLVTWLVFPKGKYLPGRSINNLTVKAVDPTCKSLGLYPVVYWKAYMPSESSESCLMGGYPVLHCGCGAEQDHYEDS